MYYICTNRTRHASSIAHPGGSFFINKMNKEDYPKSVLTLDDQIALLKERGLKIEDDTLAKHYLKNISYYRLQGYWWEFQKDKSNHVFKDNVSFDDVINLYTFDRKLRLIIFDIIERVEIALRTKMVYYLSIELGHWWFDESKNFFNKDYFNELKEDIEKELNRSKEIFIEKHYEKYGVSNKPPAYKTLEVLSFGSLSKLYNNLNNGIQAKKRIAKEFDLPNYNFLKSWLQSFNTLRNIIAHHSRLWNRNLHISPKILGNPTSDFISIPKNEKSMYYSVSCLLYVINKVSSGHTLKEKIKKLLKDSEFISLDEMGFPSDWEEQPLWS